MTVKDRYDALSSYRQQFLDTAVRCSEYTLPYLITKEQYRARGSHENLKTPWQSVGAKGVVTLASKLMLALLPPQTSFFKLQLDDSKLPDEMPVEIRTEIDTSLAKIERQTMESISASNDRVVVHQGIKHLVVGGNVVLYDDKKDGLRLYPLPRFVVDRDGGGTWVELITKEVVSHELLEQKGIIKNDKDGSYCKDESKKSDDDCECKDEEEDVEVYTRVYLDKGHHKWYQEIDGKKVKGSYGHAPVDKSPWLVLRFNVVDGESYGRGRVEEFLGDLKSLEALTQALVEGSAVAAKVLFLLDPGSTTKPQSVSAARNGDIIQGKEKDITVVQVNKAMDFRTAQEMAVQLTQRLNEAFLVMNVRASERTTAEEVRMTQLELEQQLGGLFSLLTVEFLVPYLNRKLSVLQRSNTIAKIPKGLARPTIVAGINALGRGQDVESLSRFLTIVTQTFGPDAVRQYMDPLEAIKRLAAAQGIDALNLILTKQDVNNQQQQAVETQKSLSLVDQTAALANTPLMDPTKNPQLTNGETSTIQTGQGEADQLGAVQ